METHRYRSIFRYCIIAAFTVSERHFSIVNYRLASIKNLFEIEMHSFEWQQSKIFAQIFGTF